MSGAERRRRRALAVRGGLFAVVAVGGAVTGWWWSDHGVEAVRHDTLAWNLAGLALGVVVAAGAALSATRARPEPAAGGAAEGMPSAHSPAEVGWLLRHGRVTLADLAATVVDLTARGFVVPYHREGGLVLGFGRPALGLEPHEALVHSWLFPGWAREADLEAKQAAITADPALWTELWDGFVEEVEALGRGHGLVEHEVASTPVLVAAATGLAVLTGGVVGIAHGLAGWSAAVAAGSLVLVGATAFARRTPEGEGLAARWEAFGAGLRAGGAAVTPHALAYAVTLGEEDAAIAQLAGHGGEWPAQLVHDEVERRVTGWREAYLTATSVRGAPSDRVRALLSLRALRRAAA